MPGIPASHLDLVEARIGVLATIDDAGYLQVTAVWFLFDGDALRLSLNTSRRKLANLLKTPRCSLLIPDPKNANRYLEIRAATRVEPDDDYAFADRVGEKYGTDLRTRDRPGESRVVVTLDPVTVHAVTIGTEPAPW